MTGVLAIFAALGVSVVYLRGESLRASAEIQALELERVQLRRECWSLQMQIATLNAPESIRDRLHHWKSDLIRPMPKLLKSKGKLLAEAN